MVMSHGEDITVSHIKLSATSTQHLLVHEPTRRWVSGFRERSMTNHPQIELEFLKVIKKVIFVVGPLIIVFIIVCIKWVAIFVSVS
jgi:hypothetical protein